MKKIKIIEVNAELGAGTRGSSLGIGALKVASWKKSNPFFRKYQSARVEADNQIISEETDTPFAKRIEQIYEVHESLRSEVYNSLISGNYFPVVLAGDHSSSAGSIAGVKMAHPNERIGVIWVDAHGDLHSPYTTPSGNVHGMPLAMVVNRDNMERKLNDPSDKTVKYWNLLKNSADIAPKVNAEDLVFFGLRDIEEPEKHMMNKEGIRNYSVEKIRNEGVESCVKQALEELKDCDKIYLSFDVDSMDPEIVSLGTGTPVENGLSPEEASAILTGIIKSGKVACFDMVEVNPTLDNKGNRMAEVGFDILTDVCSTIENVLQPSEINLADGN